MFLHPRTGTPSLPNQPGRIRSSQHNLPPNFSGCSLNSQWPQEGLTSVPARQGAEWALSSKPVHSRFPARWLARRYHNKRIFGLFLKLYLPPSVFQLEDHEASEWKYTKRTMAFSFQLIRNSGRETPKNLAGSYADLIGSLSVEAEKRR